MESRKKVCILTSGGDAPGMNQCVMAFIKASERLGLEPYGAIDGLKGLAEGNIVKLDRAFARGLARRAGTVLGTARYPQFVPLEFKKQVAEKLKAQGLTRIVMLGGDGTQQAAKGLSQYGISCLLIPASIDNDVKGSEFSLGFFSALNRIVESIDSIRDTMESHSRIFAVQTMGRECPDLALYAGVASGADIVITQADCPPYEEILERVRAIQKSGQRYCLIVLSEHLIDAQKLVDRLYQDTGWETRLDVLGHTQRGGSPAAQDRILAQAFGVKAAEVFSEGETSGTIGIIGEKIVLSPFDADNIRCCAPRSTQLVLEAERKAR